MPVHIRAVQAADWPQWQTLWHGYCTFYEAHVPATQTERTWARFSDAGHPLQALVAVDDCSAQLVGLAHWFVHPSTWSRHGYAYLEDLFTAPAARGQGVARALIEAVAHAARAAQADKLYWLTRHDNTTARALYNRVAQHTGFVHYAIALGGPP
jgi:ribosomal protein S18 acetylase RimI-like enzyme